MFTGPVINQSLRVRRGHRHATTNQNPSGSPSHRSPMKCENGEPDYSTTCTCYRTSSCSLTLFMMENILIHNTIENINSMMTKLILRRTFWYIKHNKRWNNSLSININRHEVSFSSDEVCDDWSERSINHFKCDITSKVYLTMIE